MDGSRVPRTVDHMEQGLANRLFAAAAGVIVITTGVAMAVTADTPPPTTSLVQTTTPVSEADIVVVGSSQYAPATAAPSRTVPIATTTTTSTSTSTITPDNTKPTTPGDSSSTTTIAANPPSELLVIGGESAALVASELARVLAPMRVRVLSGEPLTKALQLLMPTATSRIIVIDPKPPTEALAAAFITDVVEAAKGSDVLWVQDWHTKRHWWVDLVAAQAALGSFEVLAWHAEVDKTPRYRNTRGGITVEGVARLVELLTTRASSSLKSP